MTAAITCHLVAAETLTWATPVVECLPACGLPETVDIASLVDHTSGLPHAPDGMFAETRDLRDPYARFTTEYFDREILPGLARQHTGTVGREEYSNLGYAVLTRLLETVTGRTWWDLAHGLVLATAGVTDATVTPDPADLPRLRTWVGGTRRSWTLKGSFVGAGGLVSTFGGLERYVRAVAQSALSRGVPRGWQVTGRVAWHNGQTRDHGAFVGFTRTHVVTVHTVGRRAGTADRIASRLLPSE